MTKGTPKNVARGRDKGFITTRIAKASRQGPSYRKGRLGKRTKLVREVIREAVGFNPYEKRIIELLKTNIAKDAKKALRMARARLGTHRRALHKRDEMEEVIRQQKKKAQK